MRAFHVRSILATRLASAVVICGLALPLIAQAGMFDDDEARKAILELRARVNENARANAETLATLQKQIEAMGARLEQRIEQRTEERTSPALKGNLELQGQIETLRTEIARLRGQLEEQTNTLASTLAQTQRQQRDLFATVDERIKRFEPVQATLDGKPVTVDPAERRTYDAGLAQFRSGDFRAALNSFQTLLTMFPDSAYTQNAMFWSGSAHFALKDYRNAVIVNQAFLAKFPESSRAPDAALNIAYAQIESGDRKTARTTLQGVVDKYPDSPAAQASRERLASLRP